MNKQKLIEKWESKEDVPPYATSTSLANINPILNELYIDGYGVARKEILDDLKQLDEPKKVVVPKFVADWLDKHKYSTNIIDLFSNVEYATDSDGFIAEKWDYSGEFYDWLNNTADVQFTLCDAMRYGYEVKKEQLYYVSFGFDRFLIKGDCKTTTGEDFIWIEVWECIENEGFEELVKFTEQEIKAIDERYWPFAVKVDGE